MEKIKFGEGKSKEYRGILGLIGIVSIAFILFYVLLGIRLVVNGKVTEVFKLFISVLMYVSIIKFVSNVFYYGKNDEKLEPMLMRFTMSMMTVIIGYRTSDSTIIFTLIAVSLMLIPYMAASLYNVKRSIIILLIVLVITIIIAYDSIKNPPEDYTFGFGPIPYIINSLNQTIQWLIFTILYLIRCKKYIDEHKNDTIDETKKEIQKEVLENK